MRGGVDRIQLRDRSLDGRDWLEFAAKVSRVARSNAPEIEIIINRRIDVALAVGAEGVHLGFDALDIRAARSLLGPGRLIGVSTHTAEEAIEAHRAGADYVHLAPIYPPLSKSSTRPALGPACIERATTAGATVIAQGGIDSNRIPEVIEAGAVGVAVTGALSQGAGLGEPAVALRQALNRCHSAE